MLDMLAVVGLHEVDSSCPQSCLQKAPSHRDNANASTEPQVRYNAHGCDHKSNVASVARLRLLTQGRPKTTPQASLWVLVRISSPFPAGNDLLSVFFADTPAVLTMPDFTAAGRAFRRFSVFRTPVSPKTQPVDALAPEPEMCYHEDEHNRG